MKLRYLIGTKWTAKDIILAVSAIEWAVNKYNLEKGVLTVKLINQDSLCGTAEKLKSNRYEIRIAHTKEFLITIFHEITHVKQFALDGLVLSEVTNFNHEYEANDAEEILIKEFENEVLC